MSNPPLTTIRQPIVEQSYAALQSLVERANGGAAPAVQSQPTRLVVRRSCGCNTTARWRQTSGTAPAGDFRTTLVARRDIVLAELVRASRGTFVGAGQGWDGKLLDKLLMDLGSENSAEFLKYVESLVRRLVSSGTSTSAFNDVLSVLREQVVGAVHADAGAARRAYKVIDDARVTISDMHWRAEAEQRIETARRVRELVLAIGAFVATANERAIAEAAAVCFPRLGIPLCCLVHCENPTARGVQARPLFAVTDFECRTGLSSFPVRELLPRELGDARSANLAVYSIYFGRRFIGFSVQSLDPRTGFICETLREIFGMVLNTAALTSRIQELEASTPQDVQGK